MAEKRIKVKDILDPNLDPSMRLIRDKSDLKALVDLLKNNGYRIVLTQGVWDLIHEGHANYLKKAKSYGDVLIVGVDSDELTKQRKGPNRPIVPESERIKMIAHLRYVDLITIRGLKEGIGDLIRLIEPDTLVVSKSTKDFTTNMKREYKDCCGKIVDLTPQGAATTSARIRNLTIEGVEELAKEIVSITSSFVKKIKNGKK